MWHLLKSNFTEGAHATILCNEFENHIYKIIQDLLKTNELIMVQ